MLARCKFKPEYAHVEICEAWRVFETFYADMGDRPPGHTLDRIDPEGHYNKLNCKWSTPKQQARNRRNGVYMTYKGETKLMVEWTEQLGLSEGVLRTRKARGWTDEQAASIPMGRHRNGPYA